jgi:hypothetical protein
MTSSFFYAYNVSNGLKRKHYLCGLDTYRYFGFPKLLPLATFGKTKVCIERKWVLVRFSRCISCCNEPLLVLEQGFLNFYYLPKGFLTFLTNKLI